MTTTSSPPVTAVVPTHDRPEMMRRAVQSILDQEYGGDIEVIVVFDACEPVLPEVASAPGARSRHRQRAQPGPRRRAEHRHPRGAHELVAFLDDDDFWMPGKLATQVGAIEANPEASLVGTAMIVDDGEREHERLVESTGHARLLLHDRLAGLHSCSFVFRRSALLGPIGLIDEELPRSYGEDYDILLRTSAITDVRRRPSRSSRVTWQGQSYFFGQWAATRTPCSTCSRSIPTSPERPAIGRIESQIAFARASADRRKEGARWARRSIAIPGAGQGRISPCSSPCGFTTAMQVTRVAAAVRQGDLRHASPHRLLLWRPSDPGARPEGLVGGSTSVAGSRCPPRTPAPDLSARGSSRRTTRPCGTCRTWCGTSGWPAACSANAPTSCSAPGRRSPCRSSCRPTLRRAHRVPRTRRPDHLGRR